MKRTRGSFVPVTTPAAVGWLPSEAAIILALVAAPTGFLILGETCEERPPLRISGPCLTARTLTGERTVDLSVISSVRLLTYFSRSGVSERVVLVRDINGVCLGLKSAAGRAALRRALQGSRDPASRARPRVSRAAAVYLGKVTRRTPLVLHTVLSWLVMVFGTCGYTVTVLALADRIPK